jgi:peptidoglycan/LPS O-acetylase OafA/YrhL
MPYRPSLDGLRALCALGVFLFHASYEHSGGFLGVDVFFVLSGYLITGILVDDIDRHGRVRFGRFYARRARRLLPAVFLALGLSFFVWPRVGGATPFWTAAKPVLLYYVNWNQALGPALPLSHFWSLSAEEQFYFVWPLAVALLARLGRRRMAVAVGIGVLAAAVARGALTAARSPFGGYFSTFARADELLIGALAAIVHRAPELGWRERLDRVAGKLAWPGVAVLFAGFAFAHIDDHWLAYGGFTMNALAAAALIVHGASDAPSLLKRLLQRPVLVWLGRRSYGFYIYHLIVIKLFEPWRTHGVRNWVFVAAAELVAVVLVAWASYDLIESRFLASRHPLPDLALPIAANRG